MPTENIWIRYRDDFNRMTDEQVEDECERSRRLIDDAEEAEEWLEAVAFWKSKGKPRDTKEPSE